MGRALLRLIVGLLFIGHGTQKLFGWFGGHGPDGTGQFFESAGIRPGRLNAQLAGTSETAGGALLLLGLATPLASTMLSGVLCSATWAVHKDNGPWITDNGYEYPVTLLATLFALTEMGPGGLSLDAALGQERSGLGWALAELGAGAAGAAVVLSRSGGGAGAGPIEAATGGA